MITVLKPIDFRWIMLLKLYMVTHPQLLICGSTFLGVANFGPWARVLDVSGVVIDPCTGKPIPDAKVVISAWNFTVPPYDRGPTKYLVRTDKKGVFSLSRRFDFYISITSLEACAPDGRYGAAGSSCDIDLFFTYNALSVTGRNRYLYFPGKGLFELAVYPLKSDELMLPAYQYTTFSGGLGGEPQNASPQ